VLLTLGQNNLSSATGRLYAVIGLASGWTDPSAAAVVSGSGFAWSGNVVSPTSSQTFDWPTAATGLTAGTSYRLAVVWNDGTNSSTVAVSAPFSTVALELNLAGASSTQAATSGTGAITQIQQLAGAACAQASTSSTAAINQVHVLVAAATTQAAASSAGALAQVHTLVALACAQASSSDAGAIILGEIVPLVAPVSRQWVPPGENRILSGASENRVWAAPPESRILKAQP
jgi:hypothetical protein